MFNLWMSLSILSFPTPANITDVRSWFEAVSQVAYAFNIDREYSSHLGPPSWVSSPVGVAALPTPTQATLGQIASLGTISDSQDPHEIGDTEALIAGLAMIALQELSTRYIVAAQAPVRVITWERLQEAAAASPTYQKLMTLITSGLPEDVQDWPHDVHQFYPYRHGAPQPTDHR